MRFTRLPLLLHDGAVHLVTLNHTSELLATAGADGQVCVWDFVRLRAAALVPQPAEDTLRLLAPVHTLACHLEGASTPPTVTLARFSPTSPVLVLVDSAGLVYVTTGMDSDAPQSTRVVAPEDNQHPQEVSWSADGRLVAIGCLANHFVVYDTVHKTRQAIPTDTHVRSVEFDPTNTYLVALGDDSVVRVYQYEYPSSTDPGPLHYILALVTKVLKLVVKRAPNVYYRRMLWLPEGNFVAIPNASQGQTLLVLVVLRDSWLHLFLFVGHDDQCECVLFCPQTAIAPDNTLCSIAATGGSDLLVALWSLAVDQPLFVATEVARGAVVDLAWATNGLSLVFGSTDGDVGVFSFTSDELGPFLLATDHSSRVEALVQLNPSIQQDLAFKQQDNLLELERQGSQGANGTTTPPTDAGSTAKGPGVEVIPSAENDRPPERFLPLPPALPSPELLEARMSSTAPPPPAAPAITRKTATPVNILAVQKVTTKNGKRRIQPTLVAGGHLLTPAISQAAARPSQPATHLPDLDFDAPLRAVTKQHHQALKRRAHGSTKRLKPEPAEIIGSVAFSPLMAVLAVRLATPKVRLLFEQPLPNDPLLVLSVKNGNGGELKPSRVLVLQTDNSQQRIQVFVDFVPKFIHLAAGGEGLFWAVASADGSVYTYSDGGRRLLPPLVLGAPLLFLESTGPYLMAITCVGVCHVWDLRLLGAAMEPQLVHLLLGAASKSELDGISRGESITHASVTGSGVPVITTADGSGYMYSAAMGSWCSVSDSWWALGLLYWDTLSGARTGGLVGVLEQRTRADMALRGRGSALQHAAKVMLMKDGFENMETAVLLAHMENRMAVCQLLKDTPTFQALLMLYVKRLAEVGNGTRLEEVCLGLLPQDNPLWEPTLCGLDKRELLEQVVLACRQYREVQRIMAAYALEVGIVVE